MSVRDTEAKKSGKAFLRTAGFAQKLIIIIKGKAKPFLLYLMGSARAVDKIKN